MRCAVVVLALTLTLVGHPPLAAAGGAPSADATTTTTTTALPSSEGGIIPKPNTGVAPEKSGDRGGSSQILLFVAMLGGVATIGGLAYRSSVRARRR